MVFLVVALLVPMAPASATYSPSPYITVGGRNFFTSTGYIELIGITDSSHTTTLRKISGSAGYTPSGGNKFYIDAVDCVSSSNATSGSCGLYQTDSDQGYLNPGAGTNPVYPGGNINLMYFIDGRVQGAQPPAGQMAFISTDYSIANTKYLTFLTNMAGNVAVRVIGHEAP